MKPLRILYAGTPEFACPPLRALLAFDCEIVAIFTQPDRPAGRGRKLQPSPVKLLAEEQHIPLYQPDTLRDPDFLERIRQLAPDLMVVTAYGMLLPQQWLDLPRYGCWNLHASLLPRWRGAAPIQRAIAAGDQQTGMTLMQMALGLDTGPMLLRQAIDIAPDDTAATLHDKLADLGAELLTQGLARLSTEGPWAGETQDDSAACYAQKLSKEEAQINWQDDAFNIARQVRAFNPYPVCWTELDGQRLRIWQAEAIEREHHADPGTRLNIAATNELTLACGHNALRLVTIQPAGKKPMPVSAWLNAQQSKRAQ